MILSCMWLQECREACGGQGLKTENRIGHLKGEYDVQLTFEGDNNVLMQQVLSTSVCLSSLCMLSLSYNPTAVNRYNVVHIGLDRLHYTLQS